MFAKIDGLDPVKAGAKRGAFVTEYIPIKYYKIIGNAVPFELIKLLAPETSRWVEITGGNVGPHYDHSIRTALNFYISSGSARTTFWTASPEAKPFKYPTATTENLYRPKDLTAAGSFTARDGDVYLLDVSRIHSVQMAPTKSRVFIQLSWRTKTFEQVMSILESNA